MPAFGISHTFKWLRRVRYFVFCLLILAIFPAHAIGQVKNITKDEGLTSITVTCTYVDSKGIVWIGTNDGLNAYAGSKWYSITSIEDTKTGKPEILGRIETIFEDSKSRIWVSVIDKIFLYNRDYWIVFAETEIENFTAMDFYEDSRGWVWVMLEYFKNFSDISEIKFSFLSGTVEMYNDINWYKFNEDVAGTAGYSGRDIPRYYTGILQDKEENLWLGSLKGIYKFDGVDWIYYDEKDIVSRKVLELMIDKEGRVWAATEYGISYQQGDKWLDLTKKQGLCGATVYDLEQDPDGRIWAYTKNNLRFSGLNLIENGRCIAFDKHKTHLKGTIEKLLWNNGDVIAFASDGVSLYDKSGSWKHFGKSEGLKDAKYYQIAKDKSGNIWLVSNKSFYEYLDGSWLSLKEPEEWKVLNMLVDRNGAVWMGTDKKGLYKYQERSWTQYTTANGLIDNEVIDIFEDKKGNIWAITKKGISIISGE